MRVADLLEADLRPFTPDPRSNSRPQSRRRRWIVAGAAFAVFASALGYLVADQVQLHAQFDRAQSSLDVTRHRTGIVSAQLAELRHDLALLTTQVGNDSTALDQDASQLKGAQTALLDAETHVTQQASLIKSLDTCLGGVEQALNALSVGKQSQAIAAVNAVSTSCSSAAASSG